MSISFQKHSFQQQFYENARGSFSCLLRAPLMEWLTDVADVKLQVEGRSFLMNNFIKDFISLKIDHMQQGVNVAVQSSVTCKDKRSYRGEYKVELKRP